MYVIPVTANLWHRRASDCNDRTAGEAALAAGIFTTSQPTIQRVPVAHHRLSPHVPFGIFLSPVAGQNRPRGQPLKPAR
jgi:hypothetical protein